MKSMGILEKDGWAIKTYGIQAHERAEGADMFSPDLLQTAKDHIFNLLPITREEGSFYKTGFTVLHEGVQANWLLFQWWTHNDVWCQLLSYSHANEPLLFKFSTRPIVACVYETAIIWHEQKAWIENVLNGKADRQAYLDNIMTAKTC
ncbi:hypothetical protein WH96_09415 [Kiloniella spongiae]|uniref:Uncharacterized protein n=2 Tax=Kiloniella spongiae TaxID=1489064 RepID=A0A0H2MVI3_9PROT|nr:hypothetical protein WH96_09415 [Kiloniella spongiae]